MVEDHRKASQELKKLASSKGIMPPTTMLKRHQAMLRNLEDEKKGEEFDDEYRDTMVMAHKEAVSLFDQAAKNSEDPEVKALAAKLLPKLQHHGAMAKNLPED
jgi:putative membrane protein